MLANKTMVVADVYTNLSTCLMNMLQITKFWPLMDTNGKL